jgi:hypothetical protein
VTHRKFDMPSAKLAGRGPTGNRNLLAAAALLAVAIVLIGSLLTYANNHIDTLNAGANTAILGIVPP